MPGLGLTQRQIVESPLDSKLFVSGPAGAGKTTAGVERMRYLLEQGVPGESILMLTPQRTLQEPYLDLLYSPERRAGGEATPATIGGLARRMCDLFWSLAGEAAGFARPDQPPAFLTLETSQYYMAHIVRPLLDVGYFESVTIDRNRLYSQIIDNLNKAAVIGFPHTEIGTRLDASYFGDPAQRRVYADAQDCANRFRQYCLEHNLLDFSLQLEIFSNVLWRHDIVRDYLVRTYRHLIYDNVEEDGPRAHDILREWLPNIDSALLIYDEGGGFRYFLGADVQTGWALRELCDEHVQLQDSFVMSEGIAGLSDGLVGAILPGSRSQVEGPTSNAESLSIISKHFYPELLDGIVSEVEQLIANGLSPSEIVILAPYLSDALRFSITNRLETRSIPWRSHRPSRSLHDEPASHALITLAALSHPHWSIHPPKFDVAYALMQSIDGLDLVRAQLLADIVYRQRDLTLSPFENIVPDVQERITFSVGNRYSTLRNWIDGYRASSLLPLDHFLRKLFGEILSQAGFGYHRNFDSVRVAASLVESVKKFRLAIESSFVDEDRPDFDFGREYIAMLGEGVIAASYLQGWQNADKDAVLVAPAHTFVMMNRPSTVQFWLDVAASGWHERLAQPLTHPYVLSREWESGRVWGDADEVQANKEAMARLVSGLLHRCRERVYLGIAELGESGFEGRGELLRAFQKVITA
ncbi:MAG TPA: UvrD-helicase domain-containing protein [Anaerolineales bacterium]|nr:UvrD-helicase domain-containing protein [Anaerolineales bacterium]